jgi:hypothetical protein
VRSIAERSRALHLILLISLILVTQPRSRSWLRLEAQDSREGRVLLAQAWGLRAGYSPRTGAIHLLHAFRLGRSAVLYVGFADERVLLAEGDSVRLGRGPFVKFTCSFPAGAGR